MARGKFADRFADRFGDHPVGKHVGKHVRGKKITEVGLSAIFALGILALVGVWAAATAGYEPRSVFSPNWNLTDNDHWYSKFIPNTPGPLCQPAFINTGSTFRTSNGVFLWEMGKGFNVSSAPVNENNSTKANFNATVLSQYSDSTLDHCDVSGVAIDMDLMQATVKVQIYATCIDPKWPALLHTSTVYSMDPSRLQEDALWFNHIVVPDPRDNASIPDAMNELASDLWSRMRAVYLRSSNVLPLVRGLRMTNANNCALVTDKKWECLDGPLDLTNNTNSFFLYPNLTTAIEPEKAVNDWNVPTNNFINAIFAAARYDFGANMTTNLFYNTTARQQFIINNDTAQLNNESALMNTLDGATHFLEAPQYPETKVARIRTSYMCTVMMMKQTPAFIVAVLGLAFAIFGVVFAAAVAVVKKLTGRDLGASAPAAITALSPSVSIQSAPAGDSAERTEGEEEPKVRRRRRNTEKTLSTGGSSSGEYKLDSPRLDSRVETPAPSYHFNARSTDAIYAPLNDRSEAGSGAVTPTAKVSSYSSLTGLARGFADKLPFGSHLVDRIPGMPRGTSDMSIPTANNRNSGSSSKWLNMAAGAVGGAGAAGLAGAAMNQASDKHLAVPNAAQLSPSSFANASSLPNMSNMASIPNPSKLAEEGGILYARGKAPQVQQMYQPNAPSEYVPFAYPESIREASVDITNAPGRGANFIQPGATQAQPDASNPYLPAALAGAGALAAGGAGAAYAAHSSGQPAGQQQMSAAPTAQRPTIMAVQPSAHDAPNRVASPTSAGRPVGHTEGVPSRMTSPGPPQGHSASSPSRATSPGAPLGSRSGGAPARVTSPGPPVGHRSSGAPARVTSPGAPVGTRSSGAPARVTSPGPPVGIRTGGAPSHSTAAGPPVGHATNNVQAPTIVAPQPRRAPSPTWLAEQEAAAAARTQGAAPTTAFPTAQDAAAHSGTNSPHTGASLTATPDSTGVQSPLSQFQRDLMSTMTSAQNTVSGSIAQTQSHAQGAADAAAQFSSKNPFGK